MTIVLRQQKVIAVALAPPPLAAGLGEQPRPGGARSERPVLRPGSPEDLKAIIVALLPATIPTDLMSRRGADAHLAWASIIADPVYEAVTIWVMAAWPDQMLDRVDTMARTAIAAAYRVRDGGWSSEHLVAVVAKAGKRGEHYQAHRHLGQAVRLVSYDALGFEPADESTPTRSVTSTLGRAVVADLRLALGEHGYMVTSAAAALLDRSIDLAVDHLNAVRVKSVTVELPDGLAGLALFAAARPTRHANKLDRITDVFRDLPHPTSVALAHLLLGTDHHPLSALLWRQMSGLAPAAILDEIAADWRGDLPALSPTMLAFTDRRRRRMRDRCRRGDDLHLAFELAGATDADRSPAPTAI